MGGQRGPQKKVSNVRMNRWQHYSKGWDPNDAENTGPSERVIGKPGCVSAGWGSPWYRRGHGTQLLEKATSSVVAMCRFTLKATHCFTTSCSPRGFDLRWRLLLETQHSSTPSPGIIRARPYLTLAKAWGLQHERTRTQTYPYRRKSSRLPDSTTTAV